MPSDHKILSPARRAQRCRTSLIVLALFGAGATTLGEWILADNIKSSSPDNKNLISATHPHTAVAPSLANSSTSGTSNTSNIIPVSNSSAEFVVVKVATVTPESSKGGKGRSASN